MFSRACIAIVAFALMGGCAQTPPPMERTDNAFIRSIEDAHNYETYYSKPAMQAEIIVHFGGGKPIDGKMLFDTAVGKARIDQHNGTIALFDGQTAWLSPSNAEFAPPDARFHVLTWPYFLAAPFKLSDGGTVLTPQGKKMLYGVQYDTYKLGFKAGVGDAPEDWYLLYREPKTNRLKAMAYIVTYGKPAAEAGPPKIIVYSEFVKLENVVIPLEWNFYKWDEAKGAVGDAVGTVTIHNPRFVTPAPDAFVKPDDAREVPAAGGSPTAKPKTVPSKMPVNLPGTMPTTQPGR